jgi:hypothetical protein
MPTSPDRLVKDRPVSIERIREVLSAVSELPAAWLAVIALTAILSMFEIKGIGGEIAVSFRLTAITASLAALVWLPAVIRLIALAGGAVKTPAGEARTPGLLELLKSLDPETQQATLPPVIAALDVAEANIPPGAQSDVRELRDGLEVQLATSSPNASVARSRLSEYASKYEAIRREMPSGSNRTYEMTKLVAEARALFRKANFQPIEISELFASQTDGSRIISLALIEASPDPTYFDIALNCVAEPRSAFEQYHGLRALEGMLPNLDSNQRKRLREVLDDQRSGGPGKWIIPEASDRWGLSSRLLAAL